MTTQTSSGDPLREDLVRSAQRLPQFSEAPFQVFNGLARRISFVFNGQRHEWLKILDPFDYLTRYLVELFGKIGNPGRSLHQDDDNGMERIG
ncbi:MULTISPECIES: hypothetical protein [unclassified Chelatococcus]|uniref:hypothetical protein n=1 Tax=unclassified Chelatococcus TaxID=2638111 RepID=UPI001BCF2C4E|nr:MULTISPECIES: hypothetical protein [unclassified Chelatococcus]MBS7700793.1 hypothetical protein [Chelatococcus sp. YT9]MBX3559651.1 hypothetical protein [Chelatococcus sp.]